MAKKCWFKDTSKVNKIKDGWFKDTSKSRQRKEQCQRDYDPDRVDSNTYRRTDYFYQSDLAKLPTKVFVIVLIHRMQLRSTELDTSWQKSDTESHPINSRIGTLCAPWWTIVRTSMCVHHKTSSGLNIQPSRNPNF